MDISLKEQFLSNMQQKLKTKSNQDISETSISFPLPTTASVTLSSQTQTKKPQSFLARFSAHAVRKINADNSMEEIVNKEIEDTSEEFIEKNDSSGIIQISGQIKTVIFRSKEDGYAVVIVSNHLDNTTDSGTKKEFMAAGPIAYLEEGQIAGLKGTWIMHPKYGEQLKVTETFEPEHMSEIQQFLGSHFIKHVGESRAAKIYERFGENLGTIIENDPYRLTEIQGITHDRATEIAETWNKHKARKESIICMREWGFSPEVITRFLNENDLESFIAKTRKNPYTLMSRPQFGFVRADMVACRLKFSPTCPERYEAAAVSVMTAISEEGHCWLPHEEFLTRIKKMLSERHGSRITDWPNLEEHLLNDIKTIPLVKTTIYTDTNEEKLVWYHRKIYEAERYSAQKLAVLCQTQSPDHNNVNLLKTESDWLKKILSWEQKNDIILHENQRKALLLALSGQTCVITGGPGTGKTTILGAFRQLSGLDSNEISFTAPTGRAAKRLGETVKEVSRTLHLLLGYQNISSPHNIPEGAFPGISVFVVDETSMVSIDLLYPLLKAVSPQQQIIFVGDADQLPSVGQGNVLADIINSDVIPVVKLTSVHRQGNDSYIAYNAMAVRSGSIENFSFETGSDFSFIPLDRKNNAPSSCEQVVRTVKKLMKDGYKRSDILVLSPQYKGDTGVHALNTALQKIFNPHGKKIFTSHNTVHDIEYTETGPSIRVGDTVMETANDYERNVFNGDIGLVISEQKEGVYKIIFGNAEEREDAWQDRNLFDPEEDTNLIFTNKKTPELWTKAQIKNSLVPAYAMTIHKSQGGEAPAVLQIVAKEHSFMNTRPILYTGMTRARKNCVLIGDKAAIIGAIQNNKIQKRNTSLSVRIADNVQKLQEKTMQKKDSQEERRVNYKAPGF